MLEFLLGADQGPAFTLPDDPHERAELFELHRNRSIHVHCWTDCEFPTVLQYCSTKLGHRWECVDQLATEASGMEFGYVLARGPHRRPRRLARQLSDAARTSSALHLTHRHGAHVYRLERPGDQTMKYLASGGKRPSREVLGSGSSWNSSVSLTPMRWSSSRSSSLA